MKSYTFVFSVSGGLVGFLGEMEMSIYSHIHKRLTYGPFEYAWAYTNQRGVWINHIMVEIE